MMNRDDFVSEEGYLYYLREVEARRDKLRALGVPEDLAEYASESLSSVGLPNMPLVLFLEDDWKPGSEPRLEHVNEALSRGFGLVINAPSTFDFEWIEESLPYASSLYCAGGAHIYQRADLLSRAVSMRYLFSPRTKEVADLSKLPALEEVVIRGVGMISAAAAPNVRDVRIEEGVNVSTFTLSRSVEQLSVYAKTLDLRRVLRSASGLKSLSIHEAREVDVDALRLVPQLNEYYSGDVEELDLSLIVGALPSLTKIGFADVGRVTGLAALTRLPALESLRLIDVDHVDDIDALLSLPLSKFAGAGRAFDSNFEDEIAKKKGDWQIEEW